MKPLKYAHWVVLMCLLFSACTEYHYVSTSPIIQAAQKQGEFDIQGNMNKSGIQLQSAFALNNSFQVHGLYRTDFVYNSGLVGLSYGHSFHTEFNTIRPFIMVAYEQGAHHQSGLNPGGILLSYEHQHKLTTMSKYYAYKAGLGINFYLGERRNFLISPGIGYTYLNLFEVRTEDYTIKDRFANNFKWQGNYVLHGRSPYLTMQFSFDNGLFFRQSIMYQLFSRAPYPHFTEGFLRSGKTIDKQTLNTYFNYKPVLYTLSIGFLLTKNPLSR